MTGAACGPYAGVSINLPVVAAVYMALLLFGIGYNWLTSLAEKTGFIKGYTSLFVVGGVVITLAATAVISPAFALVAALAFVFSGAPMIIGSMIRHKREELLQQAREEARRGNQSEEVASKQ